MARVGRLGGALLVETRGEFFLIGNTKVPCDWAREGFEPPGEIDAVKRPYLRLRPVRDVAVRPPLLMLSVEGEELARALAARLLIERNGSVSERLWRLVYSPDDPLDDEDPTERNAAWLCEVPMPIWQIVRDSVLRCL